MSGNSRESKGSRPLPGDGASRPVLTACVLCGGRGVMRFDTVSGQAVGIVICGKCGARTPHLPFAQAVQKWNGGGIEPLRATGRLPKSKPD